MKELYLQLGVSPAVYAYGEQVLEGLRERFAAVDAVAEYNQAKVLAAMQKNRVSAACFAATTGYGYDDVGRDVLEKVYADTFHTEAALVRPQITCGTHALTVALSATATPTPCRGPCPATRTRLSWRQAPLCRALPLSCPPTVPSVRPMRSIFRAA